MTDDPKEHCRTCAHWIYKSRRKLNGRRIGVGFCPHAQEVRPEDGRCLLWKKAEVSNQLDELCARCGRGRDEWIHRKPAHFSHPFEQSVRGKTGDE